MIKVLYGTPRGLNLKDRVIAVIGDLNKEIKERLEVFGFNQTKSGWITGKINPNHIKSISSWTDIELSKNARNKYEIAIQNQFPTPIYKNTFDNNILMDYQDTTLEFCKGVGSCLIGHDVGLGKTICALACAELWGVNTLVLTKPASIGQWCGEINKFTQSTYERADGSVGKRHKKWEAMDETHYVVTSYDILKNEKDFIYASEYLKNGILVMDEIGKVKNREATRTQTLHKLRPYASLALGLTATPIENNLEEFYNILNLITPGFFPNHKKFSDKYLITEFKTFNHGKSKWVIVGSKNLDSFKELIRPVIIRYEQDEVQNLPPPSTVIREVEMSKEQKQMENILVMLAKSDPRMVLTHFSFAMENIISPSIIDISKIPCEDFDLYEKLEKISENKITPRLKEVEDLLEETGKEQVIIFSKSVKGLKLIRDEIVREPCSMVIGELNNKVRDREISDFQSGKNRVLLLSEAGEEALNLQNCHFMVIVDKPWNPARLTQLRGRIRRTGQKYPTVYYELSGSSVIEKRVSAVLTKKQQLSTAVLAKEVMY